MLASAAIRQLPECSCCRFYCGNPYIFCEVLPDGPVSNPCIYYAPKIGTNYDGEVMQQPKPQSTFEEEFVMLHNHPLFTGACPQCNYKFPKHEQVAQQYICPSCGWSDE
ncbi:hypothetical protein NIES2101_41615 [Calothrix sp. HK-06]|nr:hypothetical protein NIES2101_41615 [Calothrix sp. HK-06]